MIVYNKSSTSQGKVKDKERPDRSVVREFKAKEKIMYVARACMGGGGMECRQHEIQPRSSVYELPILYV